MKRVLRKLTTKEVLYQGVFYGIMFLIYSLDKHDMRVYSYDFAFFGVYSLAALFTGYVLVPKLFYQKKLLTFWMSVSIMLLAIYFLEEYFLEKVLVGGDRGRHVSNVFYTLLGFAPIIFMMVSFKLSWDTLQKQREVETLQSAVKESELRFLKSQINPHFLFNNLNNLYSHAIENSPKTSTIILELSSLLRYMLYDCKEPFVSLKKEIENIENFIGLHELQIEDRGKVVFSKEGEGFRYQIAPLILVVFIENAFKHSMSSQSDDIDISISINIKNNGILEFLCENTYFPKSNTDKLSSGIGLVNVKKRLELVYKDKYQLKITDQNNRYKVFLELDLKANHD